MFLVLLIAQLAGCVGRKNPSTQEVVKKGQEKFVVVRNLRTHISYQTAKMDGRLGKKMAAILNKFRYSKTT